MSDALSAILETTTAERLTTGVHQQIGRASISQTADTYGPVQPVRHEADMLFEASRDDRTD